MVVEPEDDEHAGRQRTATRSQSDQKRGEKHTERERLTRGPFGAVVGEMKNGTRGVLCFDGQDADGRKKGAGKEDFCVRQKSVFRLHRL